MDELDYLPLSYLNQLEYCERRFWLMFVNAELAVNAPMLDGIYRHERSHAGGHERATDSAALPEPRVLHHGRPAQHLFVPRTKHGWVWRPGHRDVGQPGNRQVGGLYDGYPAGWIHLGPGDDFQYWPPQPHIDHIGHIVPASKGGWDSDWSEPH